MSHSIVVAHYTEPLDWISCIDTRYILHIYHKGGGEGFSGDRVVHEYALANIGREAHTYLTHIIENYDALKDAPHSVSFFCQGGLSFHENDYKTYIDQSVRSALESPDGISKIRAIHFAQQAIHSPTRNFRIFEWGGRRLSRNRLNERFGDWFERVLSIPLPDINQFLWIPGANFAVKNAVILGRPKEHYQALLREINPSDSPEVAHFFERAWQYAFCPVGLPLFVSPFKGGTTSVGSALEMMGYKDTGWDPESLSVLEYDTIHDINIQLSSLYRVADVPPVLYRTIHEKMGPVLRRVFGDRTCASDWPMGHECMHPILKKIVFPRCKLVFLTRSFESYVKSVKKHMALCAKDNVKRESSLNKSKMLAHIESTKDPDAYWKMYYAARLDVYKSLRCEYPQDVLILDLFNTPDHLKWNALASFVGADPRKFKNVPFPWENKSSK